MSVLDERIAAFSDYLQAREEKSIAVVGHSTFLRQMTGRPFVNAEMFTLQL
ncbi:MAG: hypothetical protein IIX61_04830 [Loktanella sp.]|nr:hypothetical protein [Loktanella sp.]